MAQSKDPVTTNIRIIKRRAKELPAHYLKALITDLIEIHGKKVETKEGEAGS
jgi:hypothetical protein